MNDLRFFLFAALGVVSFMLWQAWQQDYGPKPPAPQTTAQPAAPAVADIPESSLEPTLATTGDGDLPITASSRLAAAPRQATIQVTTDVFTLEIDPGGGTISLLELTQYPVKKEDPDVAMRILSPAPDRYFVSQSGFLTQDNSAPTHHTVLQTQAQQYQLGASQDRLEVPLTWNNGQGIEITKTYVFQRGSYLIDLQQTVSNHSNGIWTGRQYQQLQRTPFEDPNANSFIRTYTGGVLYTEADKYKKVDFDDMRSDNIDVDSVGGWSAMIQHYFLAAWVPPANNPNHFYTKALADQRYVIGQYAAQTSVAPGESKQFNAQLFIGPKLQRELEKVTPGLELTVDYGVLTFIAKPIFWLLEKFHSIFSNWGVAIICVTLVIKALFFKLSETSYRSMAKMRKVQPRLTELKERCGEDRQRFNTEMMAMYKREKVNPLGGCFPILVQIPVFISLYWVLAESVELRQAPFALWIQDLSAKDPYLILPVLMGVTMFIQQKLNPAPVDPMQAKIMKMFPLVFTIFFLMFPAGLVLYWVVNNSLSIVQQWLITKRIEAGEDT